MSFLTHYACDIDHPRRRGRQWPGSHGPGCAVTTGHEDGKAAGPVHCRECLHESRKQLNDITLAEFRAMEEAQGGVCAICGKKEPGVELAVDHDHKTNRRRGLLCRFCNAGLGYFRDDPERLRAAIRYLTAGEREPCCSRSEP